MERCRRRGPSWPSVPVIAVPAVLVSSAVPVLARHALHRPSAFSCLASILCVALVFLCGTTDARRIVSQAAEAALVGSYATSAPTINFTHVTVDPETGRVYVGATNWLYQFSADLSLEHQVQTGPIEDSALCSPTDCSGIDGSLIRPTKNVNKVLVIDSATRMLVVCGSVHQGSCRRHRLDDIRESEALVGVPVAANDENSSTVAFVGPARYSGGEATNVLYVGATHTRSGTYRDMVPAIASRSLESGQRLFNIIEESFSDTARVDISFHLRDYFLVKYIYGFHSNDFVYFATVQKKTHFRAFEEWGFVSRLARVCASDAGYNTYTEITVQCAVDGIDYNLLQDAIVIKAGADLADDLRVERGSDILIGVFALSKGHSSSASSQSAICVYPLADIEQKFAENIHMCYNGSVLTRDMDYIAGSVNDCPEPGKAGNVVNFCTEAVKLNGSVPLHRSALLAFNNTTLTAVTATATGQHTVAFLGTASGRIKKVLLTNGREADEFEEIVVDNGHPILGDIHLDSSRNFVFASSPYKVAKIKVQRCDEHRNCSQCIGARNPFCGWCSLESRCTLKSECDGSGRGVSTNDRKYSSQRWLSIDTVQCVGERSKDVKETHPARLPDATYSRPRLPPGPERATPSLPTRTPSTTERPVTIRPVAFNECRKHSSCRSCVASRWSCSWCIEENACTHDASQCRKAVGANLTRPYPPRCPSDPFVQRISPLESFISGGRALFVIGVNFATLQQPKMGVFNGNGLVNESLCNVINDTLLVCPSPSVRDAADNSVPVASTFARSSSSAIRDVSDASMNQEMRLRIGFSMDDDSTRVNELQRHLSELIRYVTDPKIFRFADNGQKPFTGESIVIEGENLRLAASEAEFSVTVGPFPCNITMLSMSQVICMPPNVKPPETDEYGNKCDNDLPAVVVRIGSNLRYHVGYLRYEAPPTSSEFLPLAIGLLGAAGALLLLVSLIMLAVFRHKTRIPLGTHLRRQQGWVHDGLEVPVQSWNYFGRGDPQTLERSTLKPIHSNQRSVMSLAEPDCGRYTLIRLQPPLVEIRDNETRADTWKLNDSVNGHWPKY